MDKKIFNKKNIIVVVCLFLVFVAMGGYLFYKNTHKVIVTPIASQDKLDGQWKVVNATGDDAVLNEGMIYTFTGKTRLATGNNGVLTSRGAIIVIKDDSFSVQFVGISRPSSYTYYFDGDKLIIKPRSSNQVLTLEKQQ
jgi:hypothetical protein